MYSSIVRIYRSKLFIRVYSLVCLIRLKVLTYTYTYIRIERAVC